MGTVGFTGAAGMVVVFAISQGAGRDGGMGAALLALFFLGMASFFNDLIMPGAWATCMDVGGKYAGTVSGSMNMMGNLAGFVAPTVAGHIRDANLDWTVFLYTMAISYLLGGLCWPFIDPTKRIDE
jgi:fucose permease